MTICNLCQTNVEKIEFHMLHAHGLEDSIALYTNRIYAAPVKKAGYAPMDRTLKASVVSLVEARLTRMFGVQFFQAGGR